MMSVNKRDVTKLPHHVASELCSTRAKYRQGKKLTAVKVADNCILQQYLFKSLMMICRSLVDSFPVSLNTLTPKSFCYFCNIRSFLYFPCIHLQVQPKGVKIIIMCCTIHVILQMSNDRIQL
jgi:hypothetical protein